MARTLIITNADFNANKLATVTFANKPCTGISLDKSTDSITTIGSTSTLTATLAPLDTTDTLIWSTSDADVVTVEDGVVTAVGCGTATITATCGEYSDTCTFTVTHVATLDYAINRYLSKNNNNTYLNGGVLDNYAIGFAASGDYAGTYKVSWDDRPYDRYPYMIPKGATQIVISCTNFKPYGFWLNGTEQAAAGVSMAMALPKDSFSDSLSAAGSRTVIIPEKTGDYETLNAVAFVFRYMSGTISDAAMEEITVTFTAGTT